MENKITEREVLVKKILITLSLITLPVTASQQSLVDKLGTPTQKRESMVSVEDCIDPFNNFFFPTQEERDAYVREDKAYQQCVLAFIERKKQEITAQQELLEDAELKLDYYRTVLRVTDFDNPFNFKKK